MLEQTVGLYIPLLFGARVCYPTSRQPAAIVDTLRRERITTMIVVPRVLELLLNGILREARQRGLEKRWRLAQRLAARLPMPLRRLLFRDVHRRFGGRLDFVIAGGAWLSPELAATWERMGVKVIEGYGATECAPIVATNSYWSRVPGTVGLPAPRVEVRLSDEGEVLARGANVTSGYWEDETTTRAAFTADGWYRTGDLAVVDESGRLSLRGRLRDLIVLPSGLKVYPEDVERELQAEREIGDCVVLGLPDVTGSQHVHAVVIASGEGTRSQVGHAIERANTRLAPQQQVTGFTLWEHGDFPRTNLLKVKRHEVLAQVTAASPRTEPEAAPSVPDGGDRLDLLRRALAEVSGVAPEQITPASSLTLDLALDSLARVELAMLIENALGVALEDGDVVGLETVAQLDELLLRSAAAEPSPPFAAWPLAAPARLARSLLQRLLLFPAHALVCRPFTVEGVEHLRGLQPPLLLIANHTSHLDTPAVLRALPVPLRRRAAVAAAADYFYSRQLVGAAMSLLLNTFPFSREGSGRAVRASLERCGELADDGWSVMIYPEGTRSTTGRLQPFRSGIGLLATELQLPVVPVAIGGTHALLPKGRSLPRRGPVTVRFGPALHPCRTDDRQQVTELLQRAVEARIRGQGTGSGNEPPCPA
jgi:long-chain acyl-CoA synthetase